MKKILPFLMILFLISSCGISIGSSDDSDSDLARSQGFGNGWNLGNTLDACSYGDKANKGLSTEKSWGMPETSEQMIKTVAKRGFKTIRIPVSYHNHIIDSSFTIDSAWLLRVKQIVDWSLNAGMKVIINIHHDNLSEAQMSTTYGFCLPENNAGLKNQSLIYIKKIWKQVASYFKDYDDNLIFEILNEPRAVGTSYEWSGSGSKVSNANKIICEYEKAALDEIRSSGGKNENRFVMLAPYAASPSMIEGWSLPSDSVGGKLIVSVHAYTPYNFCMSTAQVTAFGSSQKNEVDWLFSSLEKNFLSRGIPVIIGEASASDKNNTDQRKNWFSYYCTKGRAKGIPVILWDNMSTISSGGNINSGECHGYFNRRDLTWFFPTLIDEMVR